MENKFYEMNRIHGYDVAFFLLLLLLLVLILTPCLCVGQATESSFLSLSDLIRMGQVSHQQAWGQIGLDQAASAHGAGSPLRIGEEIFSEGVGHHADGVLICRLDGDFLSFHALLGVQWQGGGKGSVIFRAFLDQEEVFSCGPLSDSDSAMEMVLDVSGKNELRLVAEQAEDGIICDMANWCQARFLRDPQRFRIGKARLIDSHGRRMYRSDSVTGFSFFYGQNDSAPGRCGTPRAAWIEPLNRMSISLDSREEWILFVPVDNLAPGDTLRCRLDLVEGGTVMVSLRFLEGKSILRGRGVAAEEIALRQGQCQDLRWIVPAETHPVMLRFSFRSKVRGSWLRWEGFRFAREDLERDLRIRWDDLPSRLDVPEAFLDLDPFMERELLEWDWRMQDGIGTDRESVCYEVAFRRLLEKGSSLLFHLEKQGVERRDLAKRWRALEKAKERDWKKLWIKAHELRREMMFSHPVAKTGPLLFVKQVPSVFSHQLTQYYGSCAQPGGGLFLLKKPGESMEAVDLLEDLLPVGSVQHVDVSWDGRFILFAFCPMDAPAPDWRTSENRYHILELDMTERRVRQITEGPFDDFCPRYLPDGGIVFLSTRRGGYHRCGRGPCPTYVLARMERDGSNLRVISRHETHEWDPAVMGDGQVLYTRWDYVDRSAVYYQQLWTTRPDGTNARIYYGNNTFNPVGLWEARSVPGSHKVMATAAAHHAMTAGSIILLDVRHGVDGLDPITRLTPDCLFPESETPVQHWHAPAGIEVSPVLPAEQLRWPGHCYRSPFPLSEDIFLAAYSFDTLIGEPNCNPSNMFGIYLVDRFGNKELIHRDLNVSSLWPLPLKKRSCPPLLPSVRSDTIEEFGTFFMCNVYEAWPALPDSGQTLITHLRVVQILPKSTPHANEPMLGLANASPGKQSLGTVPVEPDGSAYFRVPASTPICFQALDKHGRAIQMMRSLVYAQPGEIISCIGCHERRMSAPPEMNQAMALRREASLLRPGPDGSSPLSYPLLVQSLLDKKCIRCHQGEDAAGGICLTSMPEGQYTKSYNALAPRVSRTEWQGGDFLKTNSEPVTYPGRFGSVASPIFTMLLEGHQDVRLNSEDLDRFTTWMDTNALFYGSFDPKKQARQMRGESIEGPGLE